MVLEFNLSMLSLVLAARYVLASGLELADGFRSFTDTVQVVTAGDYTNLHLIL